MDGYLAKVLFSEYIRVFVGIPGMSATLPDGESIGNDFARDIRNQKVRSIQVKVEIFEE